MTFISTLLRAFLGLAAAGLLYEWYAGSLQNPLFYPTLTTIARKAVELAATLEFQHHVTTSASAFAIGFLPAAFLGVVAGLVLRKNAGLRWIFGPLVRALAGVPIAVFAPLSVIWLGFGSNSKSLLVGLFAGFVIARQVMAGWTEGRRASLTPNGSSPASDLPTPAQHDTGTALAVVSGLRWGLLLGVTGLMIGESVGAQAGLGYFILSTVQQFDNIRAMAGILTLAAPVVLVIVILEAIEAQLTA